MENLLKLSTIIDTYKESMKDNDYKELLEGLYEINELAKKSKKYKYRINYVKFMRCQPDDGDLECYPAQMIIENSLIEDDDLKKPYDSVSFTTNNIEIMKQFDNPELIKRIVDDAQNLYMDSDDYFGRTVTTNGNFRLELLEELNS